jgi:sugar phosphate isomerase/epimerase
MNLEIGGCSFSFGPRSLRYALQTLKDLGFDIVDLGVCLGNTQVHPVRAAENPERTASEVIEVLREMSMRPEECFVLDFGEPINHPEDSVRKRTRYLFPGIVKFASLVGCRSVMLIPGIVHPSVGRERSFELSVMALRELVKISDDAGVRLNVEPCQPSVAEDPHDAMRLCEEVPGLGLTLDYSHFIDPGYDQSSVEPLHRLTRHVHARQAAPGKRVEAVDKGTIDFSRIISLLREQKFEGVVAVEYVDCEVTTQCGVNVMDQTIKMKSELARLLGQSQ